MKTKIKILIPVLFLSLFSLSFTTIRIYKVNLVFYVPTHWKYKEISSDTNSIVYIVKVPDSPIDTFTHIKIIATKIKDTTNFNYLKFKDSCLHAQLSNIYDCRKDLIDPEYFNKRDVYYGDYKTPSGLTLNKFVYCTRLKTYSVQIICSSNEYWFKLYKDVFEKFFDILYHKNL